MLHLLTQKYGEPRVLAEERKQTNKQARPSPPNVAKPPEERKWVGAGGGGGVGGGVGGGDVRGWVGGWVGVIEERIPNT